MAKLLSVKGKKKPIKKEPKRKEEGAIKWGSDQKDATCFSAFGGGNYYYIASPLKIMSKPEVNSFFYIITEMLQLDFTTTIEQLAKKYKAEIIGESHKYLRFNKLQDARNCKNYLNKLLRELK